MKALTLRHPWPFAVAYLGKDVENREWDSRLVEVFGVDDLIGHQIAIHGGAVPKRGKNKAWRELLARVIACHEMIDGELPDSAAQYLAQKLPAGADHIPAEHFVIGGVVAVATVAGYTRVSPSRWAIEGQLHLELRDVVTLREPVACPGAQGFWNLPPAIEDAVMAQVPAPTPKYGHLTTEEWLE